MIHILTLSLLWFLRQIKATLFWLYLWQLKEYHIGRFVDHFRTHRGKQLFANKLLISKVTLIVFGIFLFGTVTQYGLTRHRAVYSLFVLGVGALYFLEVSKFARDIFLKKLKKPVFTKKATLLFSVASFLTGFYFISFFSQKDSFILFLLIFDIITPLFISGIVVALQPLTVLLRNQIIEKAKRKRAQFKNLKVIGITGSYGKTSTKEFLAHILSQKFKVLKTKAHQNSEVGISQCILNDLNSQYEIFIVEMGAYNRGGIKLLCDIASPKIGILTGINQQHQALFGSLDNIIKTKYELIESLPEAGLAIFNGGNEYCQKLYQKADLRKKISNQDIEAKNIRVEKEYITFDIFSSDGDSAFFKVNLLGNQNIENILMAACCAKELGMTLIEIARACEGIQQEKGSGKLIRTKQGLNVIDATYSANPHGVLAHLEYLKVWPGRKAIILPSLIELGAASSKIHCQIGKKIGQVCNLAIISTKDKFRELYQGAVDSGMKKENILFLEKPDSIFDKIKDFSQKEDAILLEGRGSSGLLEKLYGG